MKAESSCSDMDMSFPLTGDMMSAYAGRMFQTDAQVSSFRKVYGEHAPYFFCFFRKKVRAREDAQDLLIDLFVEVAMRIGNGSGLIRDWRAWMHGVAHNLVYEWYQRDPSSQQSPEGGDGAADPDLAQDPDSLEGVQMVTLAAVGASDPSDVVMADDMMNYVWHNLTPSERKAMYMRHMLGLSADEVRRRGVGWSPRYYYKMVSQAEAHARMLRDMYEMEQRA